MEYGTEYIQYTFSVVQVAPCATPSLQESVFPVGWTLDSP